jgi:hypothetical protein
LQIEPIEGIKVYPDQPRSENTRGPDGITGIGINSTALLITQPGEFELPAIRIPWWDTDENRLRYAEIPAQRFSIKPAAVSGGASAPAEPVRVVPENPAPAPGTGPVSIWMWTTLAALLGWLGTTSWLLWRMQPREDRPEASEKSRSEARLFRELTKACEQNRAADARGSLCRWAQAFFGDSAPPTIEGLRRRFSDDGISGELDQLERSLFSASAGQWSGDGLAGSLSAWRKRHGGNGQDGAVALPPLYPSNDAGPASRTSTSLQARV